jgi:hypothetical protein
LIKSSARGRRPDRGGWYESIIAMPFITGRRLPSQSSLKWQSNRGANWFMRQRRMMENNEL